MLLLNRMHMDLRGKGLVLAGMGIGLALWKLKLRKILCLGKAMREGTIFQCIWKRGAQTEPVTNCGCPVLMRLSGSASGGVFFINDAKLVEEFHSKSKHFERALGTAAGKLSSNCVLGAGGGADHRRMRNAMQRYFEQKEFAPLKPQMNLLVFEAASTISNCSDLVDLEQFFANVFVDMHLLVLFGKPGECIRGRSQLGSMIMEYLSRPAAPNSLSRNSPLFQDIMSAIEPYLSEDLSSDPASMIHKMRALVKDGSMSSQEMIENLALYLVALAPAAACVWAICHMSWHGHMEQARTNKNFLKRCLQETLRLTPSVPILPRRVAVTDTQIGNQQIKKGSWVHVASAFTHHRQDAWEEPSHFNPYRFSEDITLGVQSKTEHDGSRRFFPFGMGKHLCMGKELAKVEMMMVLSTLLPLCNFEIERNPSADVEKFRFRQHVYGFPDCPVMAKVTARNCTDIECFSMLSPR